MKPKTKILPLIKLTEEQVALLKRGKIDIRLTYDQRFCISVQLNLKRKVLLKWKKSKRYIYPAFIPGEKIYKKRDHFTKRPSGEKRRRGRIVNRVRDYALWCEYKRARFQGEKRDDIVDRIYLRQTFQIFNSKGKMAWEEPLKQSGEMSEARILRICNQKRK